MSGFRIEFHSERCTGCQACVAACMGEKDIDSTLGERPLCRIREKESERNEKILLTWERTACRHCQKPACASVCPGGGLWKDQKTGYVLYDKSLCVACGQCMKACEAGAVSFDRKHVIQKCDGCRDRVLAGLQPVCVQVCAWGAMELVREPDMEGNRETVRVLKSYKISI